MVALVKFGAGILIKWPFDPKTKIDKYLSIFLYLMKYAKVMRIAWNPMALLRWSSPKGSVRISISL